MRIYKMTATFGKLEQDTLTLRPGLNIIEAPNEWGKSTWCAFLLAMLYGLDTRAKTTKTALADKEKYAPWSGSPMAGRIDLHWQGRDITIERSTKGRIPMGVFRAYETASGLAVPELTAANCGSVLLGVEQSVFRRTGFIRQSDLPVTQDEALRRRLNALVTTGDESGDSDRLAAELKELKNKVRYNRTGLLPQAEEKHRALEEKLEELEALSLQARKLRQRLGDVKSEAQILKNHRDTLAYAAAEADAHRVAGARDLRDRAEETVSALEQQCARQPDRQTVERKIEELRNFQAELAECQANEYALIRQKPVAPAVPEVFRDMSAETAQAMVQQDIRQYACLQNPRPWMVPVLLAVTAFLACIIMIMRRYDLAAGIFGAVGSLLLVLGLGKKRARRKMLGKLEEKYGSSHPQAWQKQLDAYLEAVDAYEWKLDIAREGQIEQDIHREHLKKKQEALCGGQTPDQVLQRWQQMLGRWDALERATREFSQLDAHLRMLQEMAAPAVRAPAMADPLTYSEEETRRLLMEASAEQQRLQNRLGQYQGRMEALGSPEDLRQQQKALQQRIQKLEQTYEALTLALETLHQARQELQRRFAPRIAERARELMGAFTAGRYHRLTLREDLSLLTGAGREETLHEVLWRSDGTMDQLYLALRLAVAEELTPDAPLVLDDAFVRFDDARLKAAMAVLQQEAEKKQMILFTCQSREKDSLDK